MAFAADHGGYELKDALIKALSDEYDIIDLGTNAGESVNYAEYGHNLARCLKEGRADYGVAVCGSGLGISMALNRHKGIRAAVCAHETMAVLARAHNNANVIALGARMTGEDLALACVRRFLATAYEGGRHDKRVATIDDNDLISC